MRGTPVEKMTKKFEAEQQIKILSTILFNERLTYPCY